MSQHSKSILQPEPDEYATCYLTGYVTNLERHHIFNGPKRDWSEKNGCWVWLNHDVHMWLHQNRRGRRTMYELKAVAQAEWEKIHAEDFDHLHYKNAHEQFMKEVGKDYGKYL